VMKQRTVRLRPQSRLCDESLRSQPIMKSYRILCGFAGCADNMVETVPWPRVLQLRACLRICLASRRVVTTPAHKPDLWASGMPSRRSMSCLFPGSTADGRGRADRAWRHEYPTPGLRNAAFHFGPIGIKGCRYGGHRLALRIAQNHLRPLHTRRRFAWRLRQSL
jgi:hypothetical protein